jgi:hypothetical protein
MGWQLLPPVVDEKPARQAHEYVFGPVYVQTEEEPQTVGFWVHWLKPWQFLPSLDMDTKLEAHEQVLEPGPVYEHTLLLPQPPLLVRQLLVGWQPVLVDVWLSMHEHEKVFGPV